MTVDEEGFLQQILQERDRLSGKHPGLKASFPAMKTSSQKEPLTNNCWAKKMRPSIS